MAPFLRLVALLVVVGFAGAGAPPTRAAPAPATPGPCAPGALPGGSNSLICVPASGWNGDLVIYAHGYVPPQVAELTPQDPLLDGVPASTVVQSYGFAFATTSYRDNGLVVNEAQYDIIELLDAFEAAHGTPAHTYLIGVSEGALVATLLVERAPERFSGALAACGPIGSFRRQMNYIGNFRVLFDYFFPEVFAPHWTMESIAVPPEVIADWAAGSYAPKVAAALDADPLAARQLLAAGKAYIDPADPATTTLSTTLDLLGYHVLGTDYALSKLDGNPFDNQEVEYRGTDDNALLNASVARFAADQDALDAIRRYQTSGELTRPLIGMHTTNDNVVPFTQALIYQEKVETSGAGSFTSILIPRYGHCNFTADEVLGAFSMLVEQVTGSRPAGMTQAIDPSQVAVSRSPTFGRLPAPEWP
jgi:pimeloyl-ACP methyl ester carboxylesterase